MQFAFSFDFFKNKTSTFNEIYKCIYLTAMGAISYLSYNIDKQKTHHTKTCEIYQKKQSQEKEL